MKTIKELHVLVGLPGSGKTTFANQFSDTIKDEYGFERRNYKTKKYADIVDFDSIYKKLGSQVEGEIDKNKVFKMALPRFRYDTLILDGLFLTQKDVEWVLSVYLDNPKFFENFKVEKIIIDYWTPDKQACLWNDRGRRSIDSKKSIEHLNLERINVKKIEEKFGIKTKLETHSVAYKPAYLIMGEENDVKIHDNKYLDSSTWCLGGEAWGWDGGMHYIGSESPCNFDEFDELIEKICPTITFLQYKKLYANCVNVEERSNSDYYSNTREAFYRCDLEKLYNMLNDMDIYKVE